MAKGKLASIAGVTLAAMVLGNSAAVATVRPAATKLTATAALPATSMGRVSTVSKKKSRAAPAAGLLLPLLAGVAAVTVVVVVVNELDGNSPT